MNVFDIGVLVAWVAIVVLLAVRAEARLTPSAGPVPWRAAALCALAVVFACAFDPAVPARACGFATIALVIAAFADARTGYLPDAITAPAAVATALAACVAGAAGSAAAGVALLVGGFGAVVVCSRGRLMGLGDVKAMYALGAAFGPSEGLFAVFAACVSGIAATAVAGRLRSGREIRFGPHLAVGSAIALVAGDPLIHGRLGL